MGSKNFLCEEEMPHPGVSCHCRVPSPAWPRGVGEYQVQLLLLLPWTKLGTGEASVGECCAYWTPVLHQMGASSLCPRDRDSAP